MYSACQKTGKHSESPSVHAEGELIGKNFVIWSLLAAHIASVSVYIEYLIVEI